MTGSIEIGVNHIDPENLAMWTNSLVHPPTHPGLSAEQSRNVEIASFLQACALFGPSVPSEAAARREIARRLGHKP